MIEAIKYLNLLKKHKYTLVAVPVLVVCIAYVLVRNMPNVYISKARISSGLADRSQQLLTDQALIQESRTNQAFSNLIQMLQMKKMLDQASYALILHDLKSDHPYRKPSKLLGYLNPSARKHAIEVFTKMKENTESLSLTDADQKGLHEVLVSMGYDYETLQKKLHAYRIENSDFINVEYEAESPDITYEVVNSLCKEFVIYYTLLTKENEMKSIDFLNKLLTSKKDSLNSRMAALKGYKIKNRVLNLNEQAKSMYAIMADFETRIELTLKDIEANTGALESIDHKFDSNDHQYLESRQTMINQDILSTKQQLSSLNDSYIRSNFNKTYKQKIDSLKDILTRQIHLSTDNLILSPLARKESLVTEKLKLEINQDIAKNSLQSLQRELKDLNLRFDKLVPNEAVIQAFEGDINVADQEYLEILKKYNESSLELNSSVKLKIIEAPMPGSKMPSKKVILIAISGMASLALCLFVLFVVFYFDHTISSVAELKQKTGVTVLGYLPLLSNVSALNMKDLWASTTPDNITRELKDQLRAIRFEIDELLQHNKILAITSLTTGEGKTTLALSLSKAYQMAGKRVLLIDGNFTNPSITEISGTSFFIDDYLNGSMNTTAFTGKENELSILGNKGRDISLFEILKEDIAKHKLEVLKDDFDIILIETPSMKNLNKAKEWIKVTDKTLSVFETNKTISINSRIYLDYLQTINGKFIGWVMNRLLTENTTKTKKKRFSSVNKAA
jgi:polysaccharide biosynthesis transport protein